MERLSDAAAARCWSISTATTTWVSPPPDDRLVSDALLEQKSCSDPPDPLRLIQAVDVGTWIVPLFAHGAVGCLVGGLSSIFSAAAAAASELECVSNSNNVSFPC